MKVQVDDYVRLTEEYLFKLDVISSAIIEGANRLIEAKKIKPPSE